MEEIAVNEMRVRAPIVDGMFYPDDPAGVLSYMKSAGLKPGRGGQARAVIAPHGSWDISGSLVGAAFASAAGRRGGADGGSKNGPPSRIVVMGPIHNDLEEGIFLSNSHSFQTPIGDIPVDQEASGWIAAYSPLITVYDIPHLYEHSIEVLLPFVKYFFPQASIVPILFGGQEAAHVQALANALHAAFAPVMDDTLFVVSFNMTAHPDRPGEIESVEECMRLFREGKQRKLGMFFESSCLAGCGSPLVAALMRSRLLDGSRPCLASESLLSATGEKNKAVYYGAFSFV
ncbi:MAG: AmmeMemoRadiSam system protein B [Treponema sp.]|nr:AmmeMemoRadiSam system protein B [Treponema sp.]